MSKINDAVKSAIASAVPAYDRSRYSALIGQAANNVEATIVSEVEGLLSEVGRKFGQSYADQAKALFIERGILPEPTVTVSVEVPAANLDALAAAVASATTVLSEATAALQSAQRAQRPAPRRW